MAGGSEGETGDGIRRRGCSCTENDFLPEDSFQSFGNYAKALCETPPRFRDRLLTRSLENTELHEIKARSNHEMNKNLSWWDLIWFGIGTVIGACILVLQTNSVAGPAVVLSHVVSSFSTMLSVFCYTEFAVEIPVAGGSFANLGVELGEFMAFIAAGNILLEYVIGGAVVARSWTSDFATLCNNQPNDFRINVSSLPDDYLHLDPIAIGVITIICIQAILAIRRTKGSSRFNYIASIFHVLVILFIIIADFANAHTKTYTPFAPYGVRGIFKASAVLFFAYAGFDAVSTMAEETKNPARDIAIGLVFSMTITAAAYCLLAMVLCLMQPYQQIDTNAPFSVTFEKVGWNWAKSIFTAWALTGMTVVLLVSAVGQAEYLTHSARTHMMPSWLAQVHPKTETSVNATVAMLTATAIIAFYTDLGILSSLLSISTLFIFMLVAVALLVYRYNVSGETTTTDRNKFIFCLVFILGSSAATAAYWAVSTHWIAYVVTAPVWFLATLALHVLVPQARTPKSWGVPLAPWLPSLSIAINIFLLGSIDRASFKRFSVWTVILLIYYFSIGSQAPYDTAK